MMKFKPRFNVSIFAKYFEFNSYTFKIYYDKKMNGTNYDELFHYGYSEKFITCGCNFVPAGGWFDS